MKITDGQYVKDRRNDVRAKKQEVTQSRKSVLKGIYIVFLESLQEVV